MASLRLPAVSLVSPLAMRISCSVVIAARGSPGDCHSAINAGFVTSIEPCCTAWPIKVVAIDLATEKVRCAVWISCPPQ